MTELVPHAQLPGAGAAGGLGAALAYLGAQLVSGAELVLDLLGFEPSGYDLVVTGEGTVDATTRRGKAPGESSPDAVARVGRALCRFRRDRRRARSGRGDVALSGDSRRAARGPVPSSGQGLAELGAAR